MVDLVIVEELLTYHGYAIGPQPAPDARESPRADSTLLPIPLALRASCLCATFAAGCVTDYAAVSNFPIDNSYFWVYDICD